MPAVASSPPAAPAPAQQRPPHASPDADAREAPRAGPLSGQQRALRKLGLLRDMDLALHLPLRYEDETQLDSLAGARSGDTVHVEVLVRNARTELRPRRQLIVQAIDAHADAGAEVPLVLRFLHFSAAHQKLFTAGARVRVRGELRGGGFFGNEMVHPAFKAVAPGAALAATLTPVYPAGAALPQAYLRKAVASALQRAPLHELLPPQALPAGLPPLRAALQWLHHPPAGTPASLLEDRSQPAWQRLKAEELLAQQLSRQQALRERASCPAPVLDPGPQGLHTQLLQALPFRLTAAQQRVTAEIAADLARPRPMHRLLQGDVGAGKTVVAALAAAHAIAAGWQCALMAPTEILAEQHFRKLVQWLEPLGVEVAWLAGGRRGRGRTRLLERVASGAAALVVGTHAVIQGDVQFARLGLAVVDEQHRFGVQQRLALRRQRAAPAGCDAGPGIIEPHLLMMSATPIPRTLAMTYLADLDVSTLDELPPGRTPVVTKVFAETRRAQVIGRLRDEVARGAQAYWVCPLIEESATLDLQDARQTHAELSAALPGHRVGLLHGRMPQAEKAAVMSLFSSGAMSVLVATTVIEVGVDVPAASLMVVEHAERFGLSQLHQLRGRIGRGRAASVCVLMYGGALSQSGKARLQAMVETGDGFEIARRDLAIRGPGEFLGARQSGAQLLRFADLDADQPLLAHARRAAAWLLDHHPEAARAHVERWLAGRAEYLKA